MKKLGLILGVVILILSLAQNFVSTKKYREYKKQRDAEEAEYARALSEKNKRIADLEGALEITNRNIEEQTIEYVTLNPTLPNRSGIGDRTPGTDASKRREISRLTHSLDSAYRDLLRFHLSDSLRQHPPGFEVVPADSRIR